MSRLLGSDTAETLTDLLQHLLPPATKLGQGYIFTEASVILSGRGGCLLPLWGGVPAPGGGGSDPGGGGGGSAPEGGAWSWGGGGGAGPGGVLGGDTPGTATAAGGTYPTGMHSCYSFILWSYQQCKN